MSIQRLRSAVLNAVFGRHLRDVNFYFGTVTVHDIVRALWRALVTRCDREVRQFEQQCADVLGLEDSVSFGAGRMAFYAILEALNIKEGDEVILPGFTCVVVPNAIRYRGATAVFVDIDPQSWNLDVEGFRRAITPRTRAVLIQHTFGIPADIDRVVALARQHRIPVIEDCAHVLLSQTEGTVGKKMSDAYFFSFESSKPVTLGRGGLAAVRGEILQKRLRNVQAGLPVRGVTASLREGTRLLVLTVLHKPLMFRFGRFVGAILFRFGIFTPNITATERRGVRPSGYPARLTSFQALLGLAQLRRLDAIASHRRRMSGRYDEVLRRAGVELQATPASLDLVRLRYSFLLPHANEARVFLARRQVELGRWFDSPVTPVRLDDPELVLTGYQRGMCPVAESIVDRCANLPTDPAVSDRDAVRAATGVIDYLKTLRGEASQADAMVRQGLSK